MTKVCKKCEGAFDGIRCDECHRASDRKRYHKLKNTKEFKKKTKERSALWYKKNRTEIVTRNKKKADDRRLLAIKKYGGKCACCGEKNHRFLTFDHTNNNGAAHRREIRSSSTRHFVDWIIRNNFPIDIQVLCFNCNCGKAYNNSICPHKK